METVQVSEVATRTGEGFSEDGMWVTYDLANPDGGSWKVKIHQRKGVAFAGPTEVTIQGDGEITSGTIRNIPIVNARKRLRRLQDDRAELWNEGHRRLTLEDFVAEYKKVFATGSQFPVLETARRLGITRNQAGDRARKARDKGLLERPEAGWRGR